MLVSTYYKVFWLLSMLGCIRETRILCYYPDTYYTTCIAAVVCLWYDNFGSYVWSNQKLPAAQGFCAKNGQQLTVIVTSGYQPGNWVCRNDCAIRQVVGKGPTWLRVSSQIIQCQLLPHRYRTPPRKVETRVTSSRRIHIKLEPAVTGCGRYTHGSCS